MTTKRAKFWFTLLEVMILCWSFSFLIVAIILAINRAFTFIDNTRLAVRSVNFAREWVEIIYNMRDTNRRRESWGRDKYRLSIWKLNTQGGLTDEKFGSGIYVLNESGSNHQYFYADKLDFSSSCNEENFYSNDWFWNDDCSTLRDKAKLNFSGKEYSYYSWDVYQTWSMQDLLIWPWLEFYRIVRVFGVYEKNVANSATSISSSDAKLTDWTPAEMRFCVKVFYRWNWEHSSELCSLTTNFME